MATFYTKRNGKGRMEMPRVEENMEEKIVVGNVEIIFKFADMFSITGEKVVHVIPEYVGGIIMRIFENIIGKAERECMRQNKSAKMMKIDNTTIKCAILFKYDTNATCFEEDFKHVSELCEDGSTIVMPIFGLMNGMSYYDAAFKLFNGIIRSLNDSDSNMCKMNKIMVVTPYLDDQENTSVRGMKHLLNNLRIYKDTQGSGKCMICMSNCVDAVLSCGHNGCRVCITNAIKNGFTSCVVCKKYITNVYTCAKVKDCSSKRCCEEDGTRKEKICIPCGHFKVCCEGCEKKMEDKKCPECGMEVIAYINYYDNTINDSSSSSSS